VADPQERLEQMLKVLKSQGCRVTPQRLALLKILARSEGHPGIEQIYEQIKSDFPTTSLATVYKTMSLLKEMGEVLELSLTSLGTRYDGNRPYPHPHLVCTRCGQILDPEVEDLAVVAAAMAQQTGYRITHHQLNFFGLCPKCQQEGQSPE
jgi:Fur family peroxide stress response transcriptional regulator